jgi:hypothetical protein
MAEMSKIRHLLEQHIIQDLFTIVYTVVDDYLKLSHEQKRFKLPTSTPPSLTSQLLSNACSSVRTDFVLDLPPKPPCKTLAVTSDCPNLKVPPSLSSTLLDSKTHLLGFKTHLLAP